MPTTRMERSIRSAPPEADRSIPELLQKLAGETSLLVRQEVQLARAETMQTVRKAREPAAAFGLCALFAAGAFGALTAMLIAAFALAMAVWAAALIVTIIYAAIAGVAAMRGRSAVQKLRNALPKETVQTVADDVAAVRASVALTTTCELAFGPVVTTKLSPPITHASSHGNSIVCSACAAHPRSKRAAMRGLRAGRTAPVEPALSYGRCRAWATPGAAAHCVVHTPFRRAPTPAAS